MKLYCNVTRNNYIESRHEVYAVTINSVGKLIFSIGDPGYITCVRSTLKPFQAAASIYLGAAQQAKFSQQEISLMCASHNGEDIHTDLAKSMAKKLFLGEENYQCGIHKPYILFYNKTKNIKKLTAFHNNCSGKHSGMLAIAKQHNANPKNYIFPDHIVQKKIFSYIKSLLQKKNIIYGIDGCGAPTPFLSLREIAFLFQRLGEKTNKELRMIYQSMYENPYIIAGKKRFDTKFIDILKGRGVCKVGGEGVRGFALNTTEHGNIGVVLKVLDGNQRAIDVASMCILEQFGLINKDETKKLSMYRSKNIYNHAGTKTGKIIANIIK